MNTVITLTSKNQITIPAAIASMLGLEKGSKLWTKVEDNTIVLEKADTWDDLQGMLAHHPLNKKYTTLEIIELARKKEGKRLGKKYERMLR